MRTALPAIIGALVAVTASAAPLQPGDDAPPLIAEHTIQVPAGEDLAWDSFGDDLVVVEFWGTWCGPCIASIPHLNDLADELRDDNIHFLAVTFEHPDTVTPFLKKRPIDGWILCDTDNSIVRDYNVTTWPATFVIRNGIVVARTNPVLLTAQNLRDVARGMAAPDALGDTSNQQNLITAGADPLGGDEVPELLFQVTIRNAVPGSNGGGASNGLRTTMLNIDAEYLVAWAWGISEKFIDIDPALLDRKYDLICSLPQAMFTDRRDALQAIVTETLRISVTSEQRPITGYELRVAPDGIKFSEAPDLASGFSLQSNAEGGFTISGMSMSINDLTQMLPGLLGAPARSAIENDQKYDVELTVEGRSLAQITEAFREQAGIEIVPFETTTEYAVVKPKD